MHVHRFTIDETAPDRGASRQVLHHLRRFLTIRRHEDGPQVFAGHLETIIKKPIPEFSARFHVGTTGSETPFDGHLIVLGTGVYWGIENGRKLAGRLTREERHPWEGRDLSVRIFGGSLYLSAWVHPDSWARGEFAAWRSGSWSLNPLDHLYGQARYWYDDVDTADLDIELAEASYPVKATLQRQTYGRPKGRRRDAQWTVDVDAPKGIPNRYDRSGGWKGDRVYGFAVPLADRRNDWATDAKAAITARILKNRADSGFREPQPVDEGDRG